MKDISCGSQFNGQTKKTITKNKRTSMCIDARVCIILYIYKRDFCVEYKYT